MAAGPFEIDLAMPFGVAPRTANAGSPKRIITASYETIAATFLQPGLSGSAGSFTFTAPKSGSYDVAGVGGGGAGQNGGNGGGGGGAMVFKTVTLTAGQVISAAIGNAVTTGATDGFDTTITLPSGLVLFAGAGKAGNGNGPGAGGIATGGDFNLAGGRGGGLGGINTGLPGASGSGSDPGQGRTPSPTNGYGGGGPGGLLGVPKVWVRDPIDTTSPYGLAGVGGTSISNRFTGQAGSFVVMWAP